MLTTPVLQLLDVGFFVFHTLVIVINLTAWIWPRTRKLHLAVLGATGFSWFGLGPLLGYPLGYCLCTDWHWRIRQQLGIVDEGGYVEVLFKMAGISISSDLAATLAYGAFGAALVATLIVQLVGFARRRRSAVA
jgi:hypothetical protein